MKYGKVGERYILGEKIWVSRFLRLCREYGKVPKSRFKINPNYLFPLAKLNEFFANYIYDHDPSLTVDGLKMSKRKMYFSSEKAKKKLHYRPRNVKSAIKDAVNWTMENFLNWRLNEKFK